jgi:hypothetical protein
MSPANLPTRAPTAAEMLADPGVQMALDQAWADSQPGDLVRHEEGGWFYLDLATRRLTILRAPRGQQFTIDPDHPPSVAGAVVVVVFHTHPNPTAEGWNPGPSGFDQMNDALNGVPDLIRADNGTYFSGPDTRRGGLGGGPGYPP